VKKDSDLKSYYFDPEKWFKVNSDRFDPLSTRSASRFRDRKTRILRTCCAVALGRGSPFLAAPRRERPRLTTEGQIHLS